MCYKVLVSQNILDCIMLHAQVVLLYSFLSCNGKYVAALEHKKWSSNNEAVLLANLLLYHNRITSSSSSSLVSSSTPSR